MGDPPTDGLVWNDATGWVRAFDERPSKALFLGEWLPIETAPKDGTLVLLWGHDLGAKTNRHTIGFAGEPFVGTIRVGSEYAGVWRSVEQDGGNEFDWPGHIYFMPTHWMPLPLPPLA
jgi:hypothetical protein